MKPDYSDTNKDSFKPTFCIACWGYEYNPCENCGQNKIDHDSNTLKCKEPSND